MKFLKYNRAAAAIVLAAVILLLSNVASNVPTGQSNMQS